VILLVGDHGSRFADIGFYAHPERVPTAFVRERFGAFGAFYLPEGGGRLLADSLTLHGPSIEALMADSATKTARR